jgi:pimeloyl-ACP methyl ester carboxylesterase
MPEPITPVFIPGLLSDSRVWKQLADKLELTEIAFFAVVAGCRSLTQAAHDILDKTEGRLDIFGHSMGGRIALELVHLAPGRINRLILADTGVHPLAPGEPPKREAMIELAHQQGMEALCDRWLPPMVAKSRHTNTALMQSLREMVLQFTPEQHENQMRALMERNDASTYLNRIDCPVLLVAGREDAWSPPEQHAEILKALKHAELAIIEGSGHFAPFEDAGAFATAFEEWCAESF